jgi:MFS family permease
MTATVPDNRASKYGADATTPGPDERGAPASAWYALGVLVLTTVFAYVDRQILNLVMPSLQKSLGLSDLSVGALQGLGLALFAGVASYPMGWLADRYGRRLLLIAGILVWSISTAACAFQTSFEGLLLATIGIAVGEAGLVPIIFAMIPDLFKGRQRVTANIIYMGAGILGGALGVTLGGATLGWLIANPQAVPESLASFDAWRITMLAVALPAPLFMILVATIRLPRPADADRSAGASSSKAAHSGFVAFASVNRKTFAYLFAAILTYCLPMAAFAWLPIAQFRLFGLPPEAVGMKMGGVLAGAAIAGALLPAIATRLWRGNDADSSLRIARIFMILGMVPAACLPLASSPMHIYLGFGAIFAFCTAAGSLMPGAVQDVSPPALRTRILALVSVVLAVSQALSPMLVGAISGLIEDPRGILTAVAIVGIAGFASSLLLFTLALKPFAATVRAVQA